ncbi:hypothetical protein BASA83_010099 [Batrachochytrium salamandrivorans]|nr:hypothetical protein BASA83_010099 [Batrachochytrium salamandrivorans]
MDQSPLPLPTSWTPSFQPVLMAAQLSIASVGAILNTVLLIAMFRYSRSPEYIFNANILLMDLLLALVLFVLALGSLIGQFPMLAMPGMCHMLTIVYDGSQYATALGFMAIAITNWRSIIFRKVKNVGLYITGLAHIHLGDHIWPRHYHGLERTSRFSQNFNSTDTSTYSHTSYRRNPYLVVGFILLLITPVAVILAYSHIYLHIRAIDRKLQASLSPPATSEIVGNASLFAASTSRADSSNSAGGMHSPTSLISRPAANTTLSSAMKTLALRGFITTAAFIALWAMSMAGKLMMRFQGDIPRRDLMDAGFFLYILTTVVNPLVFVACDYRLSRSLLAFCGWRSQSSHTVPIMSLPARRSRGVEFPIEATSDLHC